MNIYIHVPFCVKKCGYCAFYSECGAPDWQSYKNQILSEIEFWPGVMPVKDELSTIFFGGGTPSLMPAEIFADLMSALSKNFGFAPDCEITVEANPGTFGAEKLREFAAVGMNRISIGAQSLRDDELKFLGRIHNAAQARALIRDARSAGIRVSADFIYGLPGQTARSVRQMCVEINSLELGHASLYELSIESGSKFSHQNLHLPDNDEMARMYAAVGETLALPRYEVSNYGDPCLHNVNVWDGEQYLGLGPGAAGRVLIDGQWHETSVKASPLKSGELRLPDIKTLSARQRAMEMLITGLRAVRGVRMRPEIMEIIDLEFANQSKLFKISAENGEKRLSVKNFLLLDSLMVSLMQ